MRTTLFLTIILGLTGCVIGQDKWPRPRDLDPTWLVNRPRVLAIRAEPPEIRPGQTATFEALLPTPGAEDPMTVIWLACPPIDDGGIGFGCSFDLESTDLSNLSEQDLIDAGLIGLEPFMPPLYTAPEDILDNLPEESRSEGTYVLVQVTAVPPDISTDPSSDEIDFNEVEAAYKRIVVSEASTPNHNPAIASLLVDRVEAPLGSVVHVDPGQTYDLALALPESAIETYEYVNVDGELEQRIEEPYASWFTTDGQIHELYTLFPYLETSWTAPAIPGKSGTWYAVLRDRRGGMTWWSQDWKVDGSLPTPFVLVQ